MRPSEDTLSVSAAYLAAKIVSAALCGAPRMQVLQWMPHTQKIGESMGFDKTVALPAMNSYHFDKMEIGESFLADGPAACSKRCKAYNAAQQYSKNHPVKFAGRKEPGQPGKVRIWRTA